MVVIDELDAAILAILQNDARTSNREVASRTGVSPTTALERTRALRDKGLIQGTTLDVDLTQLGRGVQALISVRVRPPSRAAIEDFRDWVTALPETIAVFVTTGDHDFLVHVAVRDNEALYAFVIDKLTSRPELSDVHTSVIYEHIRKKIVEPTVIKPRRA
ncbi:Lrp/AsnC family transcriptional regulator [Humibacter ginsengisoli]